MELTIPSAEQVRDALSGLTLRQLQRLADLSGVPFTTVYKIKRGETGNPGIETARQFMPYVAAASVPESPDKSEATAVAEP